ncbi:MAG: ABC transporter ATP-binding protein [Lachnospiraceae bacterium]
MELQINHLEVSLQKDKIIKDVSFTVKSGEFVSLLGASGCGKTTILKSIAGLLEIDKGSVCLDGREIQKLAPEKRGTVIVFQDLRLFPHMNVEKNISFPLELKKVPKNQQKQIVKKLLAEVKLSGYEKRKIREMSGGQLQRVALARALAGEPSVLLLDEPFSGLDEKLRLEMGELVKKIQKERKITTILVTHDKREALRMSDRIALMDHGSILQYDSPRNIFEKPENRKVAEYFGRANYIKGIISEGRFESAYVSSDAHGYDDGEYELLVRPFDVKVDPKDEGMLVEEMVCLGETAELILKADDRTFLCQGMSVEMKKKGIDEGKRVSVRFEPETWNYFPMVPEKEGDR